MYVYIHVCAIHQEIHYSTGRNDWVGFAPNPPCNLGQWFWSPRIWALSKNDIWSMSFHEVHDLHPGRLTWNLQITHLERKMIFQTSMIMFHVDLQGCIISFLVLQKFQISKPVSTQFQFKISNKNIHKTTKKKQIWQHSPSYKKTKLHWRILRGAFFRVVWITIGTRLYKPKNHWYFIDRVSH